MAKRKEANKSFDAENYRGPLEKEVTSKCPRCNKSRIFKLIDIFGPLKDIGFYECPRCEQNVTSKYFSIRK